MEIKMELDELAQRLAMLEDSRAQEQAMGQQSAFMDKYGTKFSGDEGIGVAILGELSRRGIDTSAADEAVQEILDTIRAEATQILDKIKMDERTVSGLMDKVGTMEEAIQAASGAVPGADVAVGTPPPDQGMIDQQLQDMAAAGGGEVAGLPPEGGEMPMDAGAGGGGAPPPAEEPLPEGPPNEMPPAAEQVPQQPPPQQPVLSDERLKNIRSKVSQVRTARAAPPPVAAWKPPQHLLAGVRAGL